MTSFFEHQRTSYKKNYLKTLIVLASSDGVLDGVERELIVRIGLKRGLKPWQVEEILNENGKSEVFMPESIHNRMNMLYDLMQVIYADKVVDAKEIAFMENLVDAFRLKPEIIVQLMLLFENSAPSRDEWANFTDFACANLVIKD
jgi:uncharacterized tellurite resistance protein B-like protein